MSATSWGIDPLILAGQWTCGCDGEGWPTEAVWLTGNVVLASFRQEHRGSCRGARSWSALIHVQAAAAVRPAPGGNAARARKHYQAAERRESPWT